MSKLPTLFVPHGGGPCFFMDWDPPDTWVRMAMYLRGVPADVGARPRAVVVISGHWEEKIATIQNNRPHLCSMTTTGFHRAPMRLHFRRLELRTSLSALQNC